MKTRTTASASSTSSVGEANSKRRKVAPKTSLTSLSQTVEENRNNIQALLALPEVVNQQSMMLQKLLDEVQSSNSPSETDESQWGNDEGLHGAAMVDEIVDELIDNCQNDKIPGHVTVDSSINDIVTEVLNANETENDYGAAIPSNIAEAFRRATAQLPKEAVEKLRTMHKPPENLKELAAPKVNAEIWNQLPRRALTLDAGQQYLQQFVSRAMVSQTKLAELISVNSATLRPDVLKELLSLTMEGANQMGYVFHEMSTRRRQQIKPYLSSEVANVCNSSVPVTEYLFGNNLDKELTTARASSKIMRTASRGGFRHSSSKPWTTPSTFTPRNLNWKRPLLPRGGKRPFIQPRNPNKWTPQFPPKN